MNDACLGLSDLKQLAAITSLPLLQLQRINAEKESHYGSFFKEKKDGSKREINPPKPQLAAIQRSIKDFLQSKLRWTTAIHGGVPGKSIVTNARPHINKSMVANLDISKFFPSTRPFQVEAALIRAGCSTEVAALATGLTTFRNGLPQGSATSMILSNLVLEPMDSKFLRLSRRHALSYTRYVDDLTISGNIDLGPLRGGFIDFIRSAGFDVQMTKVHLVPKSERQIVTGLVVNQRLRPTAMFLSDLKKIIRRCWLGPVEIAAAAAEEGLEPHELLNSIHGKVMHVKSVDTKLGRQLKALLARIGGPKPQYPDA